MILPAKQLIVTTKPLFTNNVTFCSRRRNDFVCESSIYGILLLGTIRTSPEN